MATGDVVMVPVSEILSSWRSVDRECYCEGVMDGCACSLCERGHEIRQNVTSDDDSGCGCGWATSYSGDRTSMWEQLLEDKSEDAHYSAVVKSLQTQGFLRPSTFFTDHDGCRVHGDGHHRLAAAVALGVTHIPYQECSNSWPANRNELISADSGSWRYAAA